MWHCLTFINECIIITPLIHLNGMVMEIWCFYDGSLVYLVHAPSTKCLSGPDLTEGWSMAAENWRMAAESGCVVAEGWRLVAEVWRILAEGWCVVAEGRCVVTVGSLVMH